LGGALLLPEGSDDVVELSRTAALLWGLLETPTDVDEAIAALADLYGKDVDDVATGVRQVLADLHDRGAVSPAPSGP
jgi:hypothetical protein